MVNLGKKGITTIIFDNNGVLTTNDNEGTYDAVSKFFGISVSDLKPIWDEEARGLDDGQITTEEFYKRSIGRLEKVKSKLKSNDLSELRKVHLGAYKVKKEMHTFAKAVKTKYTIALLSNFGDSFDECNEKWKLNEIFDKDKIFVSAKLKMRKPNEEIYGFTLDKLHVEAAECIFIDDKPENVEAAVKLGMKGIVFKDLSDLKRQLSGILGRYFF